MKCGKMEMRESAACRIARLITFAYQSLFYVPTGCKVSFTCDKSITCGVVIISFRFKAMIKSASFENRFD